ncbi:MAG TPA: hypothetical protein VGP47_10210 [Parachlamydiaceae bacterium]|nr:hypothetical protein [Parachlamydiaceae bacterium]
MILDNYNFTDLISSDYIFWFCALAGSGMFIIQFILNLLGFADQDSFSSDADLSNQSDYQDAGKFKWLSMQAITGFLMMFGWTAITCKEEFDLQNIPTIAISLGVGIVAAFTISSIFKLARKLQSPGSKYRIEDAIGKEAYVYQTIPKSGTGKISISIQGFTQEIDAITQHHEELPSFTRVKIINKSNDSTVVVMPL